MDWRGCSHCVDIWTGGTVVTVWTNGRTGGAVDTVWTYGRTEGAVVTVWTYGLEGL